MLQDRINGLARRVPVWAVWLLGLAPAVWTFYLGLTGGLGAEPIKALERELGEVALQLVILGLCITPLRRHLGVNLIRFRRAVGLLAFTYVCLHLLVWLVLDVQIWAQIWADILKRPYVTVGFTAFLMMCPLALTSNDLSVRRLGPRWRVLHRLTYAVAILAAVHFIWLSKGFQIEPLVYLGVIL
ncbi:MAG: protein-methionine-sulfoxide reductase heme-binding subunit MsrQ, partial [Roseovarius sp.]